MAAGSEWRKFPAIRVARHSPSVQAAAVTRSRTSVVPETAVISHLQLHLAPTCVARPRPREPQLRLVDPARQEAVPEREPRAAQGPAAQGDANSQEAECRSPARQGADFVAEVTRSASLNFPSSRASDSGRTGATIRSERTPDASPGSQTQEPACQYPVPVKYLSMVVRASQNRRVGGRLDVPTAKVAGDVSARAASHCRRAAERGGTPSRPDGWRRTGSGTRSRLPLSPVVNVWPSAGSSSSGAWAPWAGPTPAETITTTVTTSRTHARLKHQDPRSPAPEASHVLSSRHRRSPRRTAARNYRWFRR